MNINASDIVQSPALYPLMFDLAARRVVLIRLSEADYRIASFLDDRIVTPGMAQTAVPRDALAIAARDVTARPLHFIFHTGHVGSTLLSRLLDELPGVLGLREPSPLRQLSDVHDGLLAGRAPHDRADFDAALNMLLLLWSRGFADTRAVVVKATSVAGRIAPVVMAAAPDARAVYLNLRAESYITAILAAAAGIPDIKIFAGHRNARLAAMTGNTLPLPQTPGELAAVAWLVERRTQDIALKAAGARMLEIDFEFLLANLEETLGRIAAHFALDAPPSAIAALASSPVLSRYSKAPHRLGFSPAQRTAMMNKAREVHGAEIARGLAFLDRLMRSLKA